MDHLGLVAGRCDALGIGAVLAHTTPHTPATRLVTVGRAVKAMVRNGLGVVNHHRSLVPRVFQHKPTPRLGAPGIDAEPRNDAAVGRALETLAAAGVTALSRLIAAPAAERVGLAPRFLPLDRPRCQGDGRENSEADPAAQVLPLPRGSSREHRPALHQVLWARIVEHRAGIPVRMQPRSGHRRDATDCGAVIRAPMDQGPIPSGAPSLGADRARDSAETRQQRAAPPRQWSSRVPATGRAGQAVLAHAAPTTMGPLREDDRSQTWAATDGGGAQRGLLVDSAQRRAASQRPVDTPWRTHSDPASTACKTRGRPTCAGAAEAHQALAAVAPGLATTALPQTTIPPLARDATRGRPGQNAPPAPGVSQMPGARASSLAPRETRRTPHRGVSLATHALEAQRWSPPARLPGDKGQRQTARGGRLLQAPPCCAAALSRNKPERIMALLMGMTGCVLVYAAGESRMRQALVDHGETFPPQTGQPIQTPTARWVLHSFVGMHWLRMPGEGAMVRHLNDEHRKLLRLLGKPSEEFSS